MFIPSFVKICQLLQKLVRGRNAHARKITHYDTRNLVLGKNCDYDVYTYTERSAGIINNCHSLQQAAEYICICMCVCMYIYIYSEVLFCTSLLI
jgi:predicted aminopeptidase